MVYNLDNYKFFYKNFILAIIKVNMAYKINKFVNYLLLYFIIIHLQKFFFMENKHFNRIHFIIINYIKLQVKIIDSNLA